MRAAAGHLRGGVLALAVGIGLSAPVLAQEAANLAAGKSVWNRAQCTNCHGNLAQGGNGGDYPIGPSLRTTALDKETMTLIVSCGLPGTQMPAWLKGAYTEVECWGEPLGHRPDAGVVIPGILSAEEITALVDYIFAEFVQTTQQ